MTWKPIDVAPRDGETIVLALRSPLSDEITVCTARWGHGGWEPASASNRASLAGDVPFAWTPVPKPQ
jgi:hypothetical protein